MHDAEGFILDRIQTGGVASLNIPQTKIYELGNWKSVGIVRDTPDLSFTVDTLDVSTEVEAILTGVDPTTVTNGQQFDFLNARPLDVISPFKSNVNRYDIVKGIVVPNLSLSKVDYNFGLTADAATTYTLNGDAMYYTPAAPYQETFTNTGATTYAFTNGPGIEYTEAGVVRYALSVCLRKASDSTQYKRLFHGQDYTDTSSGFTLLVDQSATYDQIHVTYASLVPKDEPQSVHQGTSVKPAAVRGKDIDVYIGTPSATPTFGRWTGVQAFTASWAVTLEADKEFGNYNNVDYSATDTPAVTGKVSVRSYNLDDLYTKIAQVANVSTTVVMGVNSSIGLPMIVKIRHPDTGAVLKSFYTADARFTVPNIQGKANTKIDVDFNFESDTGSLTVVNGDIVVDNWPTGI